MRSRILGGLVLAAMLSAACGGTPSASTGASSKASGGGAATASSKSPVTFAAVTDTTGPFVLIGAATLKGVQLAVKDINAKGGIGGRQIDLKVFDAGDNNNTAVNAMRQALAAKPVVGMGLPVSTQAFAVSSLIKQANLPFITDGGATGLTQQHIKALFDDFAENNVNVTAASNFAVKTLKAKRIAVIYTNEAYGQEGDKYFKQVLPKLGATIVAQEPEQMSDSNFTAQLTHVAAAKPDAIIVWDQQNPMILTDQEIHQLGIHAKVINSLLIPASVKLLTPAEANGIYAAGELPSAEPNNPTFAAFVKQVQAAYHEAPDGYLAMGYDAVHLFANAIAKVGTNPNKIENYLLNMKPYTGVYGTYTPWPDGSLKHSSPIAEYANGGFKYITTISVPKP